MIAGYKEDLKHSFFNYNDGLERRFSIHFRMEPYTDAELVNIFKKKLGDCRWTMEEGAIDEQVIKDNKQLFKYHGGDIELLIAKCKIAHSKNILSTEGRTKRKFNRKDIMDGIELLKQNKKDLEIKDDSVSAEILRTLYA